MSTEGRPGGAGTVAVVILVILFGATVWPTMFRTYQMNGYTYREHRLTGSIDVFTPTGWKPMSPATPANTRGVPLEVMQKLDGKPSFYGSQNSMWVKLYNGSDWTIDAIVVEVRLTSGTSRRYSLKCDYKAVPLQTSLFEGSADVDERDVVSTVLLSATGTPPSSTR